VDANKYYIMVDTPEGAWGLDKLGLYLERLLPFQKAPEAAECDISAYGMPDPAGLEMAANGINESFVVKLQCGNCRHEWLDAVRYQTKTAVCCPKCKKVNRADTTNIQRITIRKYPLFERFLAGLTDDGRSKASSAMSSISLANEIFGVYPADDSFSAALQFAQSLPKHFHPIGVRLSPGGALYVRCAFMSAAEFNSVVSTLKRGCARIWTDPDEAHVALHGI
jgi:phage FluMu protein Com